MSTQPRKSPPKKQSQPVIIKRETREHNNGITDRRRKCIVCEQPIGDAQRVFGNHQGNIGMAHKVCESRAEM